MKKHAVDRSTKDKMAVKSLLLQAIEEELMRPEGERDEQFIEDCFAAIDDLKAPSVIEGKKARYVRMPKWAVAACTVVMALLIGSGIAEACGVRVWKALTSWDVGYLSMNYVAEDTQDDPSSFGGALDNNNNISNSEQAAELFEETFDTPEEGAEALGINVLLPGELPEGYELKEVIGINDGIVKQLFIDYQKASEKWLNFSTTYLYGNGTMTNSGDAMAGATAIERYTVEGQEFLVTDMSDYVRITWQTDENVIYIVSGTEDVETMKQIVSTMI